MLPILVVLTCLIDWRGLAAQPSSETDPRLRAEIEATRQRLRNTHPDLDADALNRQAEAMGRSNHLARLLIQSLYRADLAEAEALLKEFPGTINDLSTGSQSLLVQAVYQSDDKRVGWLLERGAHPDGGHFAYPDPPLIAAIQQRRWNIAELLVEAGASLTLTNRAGQTPASVLFQHWQPSPHPLQMMATNLVARMLEKGLDAFAAGGRGDPPRSIVEECLNRERGYGSLFYGLPTPGPGRESPALLGDLLLTNRSSPIRRTPGGDTALHLAATYCRTNALDWLLANGFSIDQPNNDGLSPLQMLLGTGEAMQPVSPMSPRVSMMLPPTPANRPNPLPPPTTIADLLIERGAGLNVFCLAGLHDTNGLTAALAESPALATTNDHHGRTPLHYALINATPISQQMVIGPGAQAFYAGSIRVFGPGGGWTVSADSTALLETLRLLLDSGADASIPTTRLVDLGQTGYRLAAGTTPLHLAAQRGNHQAIRLLLNAGGDVAAADTMGNTPLHVAAQYAGTNIIAMLLKAGSSIDSTNHDGRTALWQGISSGRGDVASALLNAGASMTGGVGDSTLLHLAASRNSERCLTVLLDHGLKVDCRDGAGRTPLHRAVQARAWDSIQFLLEEGARINVADPQGDTALHQLAAQSYDEIHHPGHTSWWAKWMQQQMMKPNWVGRSVRWVASSTPLKVPPGPVWTNTSLTVLLVKEGAKGSITNHAGQTPLHSLLSQQWIQHTSADQLTNRVQALLSSGARLDQPDASGVTPLLLATRNSSPEMLAFLLQQAGNAIELRDASGCTLLQAAVEARNPDPERVAILISVGADPNAQDSRGRTALHRLVEYRTDSYGQDRGALAALLLTNRANPNLADADGNTPLHVITQGLTNQSGTQMASLIRLLNQHGARMDATNRLGQTPLHLLSTSGRSSFHPCNGFGDTLHWEELNFSLRDASGQTPAHLWAANLSSCFNCIRLFTQILTNQGLVNLPNSNGDTPLHVAVRADNHTMARELVQLGAELARTNASGQTPLRLALEKSPSQFDQDVRPSGLRQGFFNAIQARAVDDVSVWLATDPSLISFTNREGLTPLLAATATGDERVIALFLQPGVPVDALSAMRLKRSDAFREALAAVTGPIPGEWMFESVQLKQLESLQQLATAGGAVDCADDRGHSLLFRAHEAGAADIVDWLTSQSCPNTFFDAIAGHDLDQVRLFLEAHPACATSPTSAGYTPLYQAVIAGNRTVVHLLIQSGAEVNATIPGGWTALHAAAASRHRDLVAQLLEAGAAPDLLSRSGEGALHLASVIGDTNLLTLLIDRGAKVNLIADDRSGSMQCTPLHWAAQFGRVDACAILLAQGADPSAENRMGRTPLQMAGPGPWIGTRSPPGTKSLMDPTLMRPEVRASRAKLVEAVFAAHYGPHP